MKQCAFYNCTILNLCSTQLSITLPIICTNHLADIFNVCEKFEYLDYEVTECISAHADNVGYKLYAYNPTAENGIVFQRNDTIFPISEYFRAYINSSDQSSKGRSANDNELKEQYEYTKYLQICHAFAFYSSHLPLQSEQRIMLCNQIIDITQRLAFNALRAGIRKGTLLSNYIQWLFEKPTKYFSINNYFRFSKSIQRYLELTSFIWCTKNNFGEDTSVHEYEKIVLHTYFKNYLIESNFGFYNCNTECNSIETNIQDCLRDDYYVKEIDADNFRGFFRRMLLNQYHFIYNESRSVFSDILSGSVLNILRKCLFPVSFREYKNIEVLTDSEYFLYIFEKTLIGKFWRDNILRSSEETKAFLQGFANVNITGPQLLDNNFNTTKIPLTMVEMLNIMIDDETQENKSPQRKRRRST